MSTNETPGITSPAMSDPLAGMGSQMRDVGGPTDASGGPVEVVRDGESLVEAAATGDRLSPPEQDLLTSYYLTPASAAAPKPGAKAAKKLRVDFPDGKAWSCTVGTIGYDAWLDAQGRGTNDETGTQNQLVVASWIVARALKAPTLGPILQALQQRDPEKAPSDAAALLRDFFSAMPGGLLSVSGKIVGMSGLNMSTETVVEVEAAKS